MKNFLWKSLDREIKSSNLSNFEKYLSENYQTSFKNNYEKIWNWSIKNSAEFWKSIWKFSNIKGKLGKKLFIKSKIFYKNKFLPDSSLNFSENILKKMMIPKPLLLLAKTDIEKLDPGKI